MAVEIQLQISALAAAISRGIQAALYQTCLPSIANVFVDHLDVVASSITISDGPGSDARLLVPIDVFVVTLASLELAANQDPPGAKVPAGRVVAEYSLAVTGTALSFSLADLRSEPPNPQLDLLLDTMQTSLPVLPGFDLASAFSTLGHSIPVFSEILVLGSLLVIRFDPVGPAASHLFPGQEWGLFIDGPGVVALVLSLLPPLPFGAQLTLNWNPAGNIPRVLGRARIKPPLPDPFTADVELPLSVSLGLVSSAPPLIRATVNRMRIQIHASGVPGFIEAEFETMADDYIARIFNPAVVGGTRIDDRTFFVEQAVSPMQLGGADLLVSVLQADSSGMTLGGVIRRVFAEWTTLSKTVARFGLPSWFGTCRGRQGNAPPKTLKISDVDCNAGVSFSTFGAFCGATMLDPGSIAAPFLTTPVVGVVPGGIGSIGFSIPAMIARRIDKDVKLILRTARGVRLIDLGRPIVKVDEEGNVEFITFFVPDCLHLSDDQMSLIKWAKGKGTIDIDILDPPLEDPGWLRLLSTDRGFEVQLVSFAGLTPGELLSFRSVDHEIDVTADATGQVMVPVFLPMSETISATTLERINRQSVAGKFRVRSAAFVRGPILESGAVNQLDVDDDGGVRLTRGFGDRWTRHVLGMGGIANQAFEIATGTDEVALNPQPLPPEPPDAFLAAANRLPGLHKVVLIPGFESEPVAVARMKDGSAVLLQDDGSGSVRVAGSFKGPIGDLATAGNWSMSIAQERVTMFAVERV